jgi:hypothetical protein
VGCAVVAFAFPVLAIPLALFVPAALLWTSWMPKPKSARIARPAKTKRRLKRKGSSWTNGDLERLAQLSTEPDVNIDDFASEYLGRIERHESPAILNLADVDLTQHDINLDAFLSSGSEA